ncbi:hypothetical protein ACVHUA_003481 [Proteus mirabilis]
MRHIQPIQASIGIDYANAYLVNNGGSMTIDDFHSGKLPMPKLFRAVRVEFDSLVPNGPNDEYWVTTIRYVRRVRHADGWRWQLVRTHHKGLDRWDPYLELDRQGLNDINHVYGLIK